MGGGGATGTTSTANEDNCLNYEEDCSEFLSVTMKVDCLERENIPSCLLSVLHSLNITLCGRVAKQ